MRGNSPRPAEGQPIKLADYKLAIRLRPLSLQA